MSQDPENPTPRDAASDTPAAATPAAQAEPAGTPPGGDDGARDGTADVELPAPSEPEAPDAPATPGAAGDAAVADAVPAPVDAVPAVADAVAEGDQALGPVASVDASAVDAVPAVAEGDQALGSVASVDASAVDAVPAVAEGDQALGPVAPEVPSAPEPVRPVDVTDTVDGARDVAPRPTTPAGVPAPRDPWAPPVPLAPGYGHPAAPAGYNPWAPPPSPPVPPQEAVAFTKRPVPEDAPAPVPPRQPHDPWAPPSADATAAMPPQPPHATLPGQPDAPAYPGYPGFPGYPGQAGYPGPPGYPGYPGYPAYGVGPYAGWAPPAARNGLGLTAMILGIVGLLLGIACFGAFLGLPLGIAAVICGIIGLRIAGRGEATNRPQAMTGLILGIVSVVLSGVMIVLLVGGIQGGWFDGMDDDYVSSRNAEWDDPLEAGGTALYDDGVHVTVSNPRRAGDVPKSLLGKGTAVTFTVEVVNTGKDVADLHDGEISVYSDDTDEESLLDLSSGRGLPDELEAGARTTTQVLVVVPEEEDDGSIAVEVAPGYVYDYTYWSLDVAR